jgi:hypothetical protein
LLKSKDKLYEQEKIWQKIMTDIGLPYKWCDILVFKVSKNNYFVFY